MSDLLTVADVLRGLGRSWRKAPALVRLVRTMGMASPTTRGSLGAAVAETARRYPDDTAIRWEDGSMTWRELDRRANQVAGAMARLGVIRRSTVAVMLDNRPELLVAVTAITRLGAAASMLNIHQKRGALSHSLQCAPPHFAVVGDEWAATFEQVRGDLDPACCLWVRDGAGAPPPGWYDLEAAADERSPSPPSIMGDVRLGDAAFYIFTSGTTGMPKASVMSHYRWVGAGYIFGGLCLQLEVGDTIYAPLPLYHNQALTMCWSSAVRTGAALAIARRFRASNFWDECRRHGATVVAYIGEVARYLLAKPPSASDREHRVEKAVGVGMRADLWEPFKQRFGIPEIYEFYSASELNIGFFNVLNLDHTVGFGFGRWALVAWDPETGEPLRDAGGRARKLGRGDIGLLVTRDTRRFRFEGYTDPKATKKKVITDLFEEGDRWVNTGDLMRDLGFGHLQFVDRVGDTFRWKGENVAASEVETVAATAPTVAEAAVYGVRVPEATGRAGMVAVVPANGHVDTRALLARFEEELPPYAVPIFLRETPSLERTGTFKHIKTRLRDEGYDLARAEDPIYVRLPGADDYERLTTALLDRIRSRRIGF